MPIKHLVKRGVEVLPRAQSVVHLPKETVLEPPCSLKWVDYEHSLSIGAFSYHVSGYSFAARIGRYCSFGENVQIGRQNHPLSWASTSPAFYLQQSLFEVGDAFDGAEAYHGHRAQPSEHATRVKITTIGNDVWIGHGAFICAGVSIGDGAVIGAHSVVSRDVPPYAVVAGNPAVVKRYRVAAEWISPLLRHRWWRFAPWQLSHLDVTDIPKFVAGLNEMSGEAPYAPNLVTMDAFAD